MTISVGTKLGPYELLELIGAGGMGEVYRAQDTRLGRVVAVKVLLGTVATDPERLRRFEQEAKTLAALNHPNILAVYDIGTVDGTPYLVSEFLEGETLRGKLEGGPVAVRRAVEYALGIANGLAAGHSKGIIHRDIKPENIFLTRDGRVKILDFGLAKLVQAGAGKNDSETMLTQTLLASSGGTTPGVVLGTVGYMSPEQVRGEPAEATSDIFSFGAVLYETLSGKRAFKRDTAAETMTAVLREEPPELMESGWHGPPGLQRILDRCLEKDATRRFQSASDLAFAIEALSGTSGSGISQSGASQSAIGALPPIAAKSRWWIWPVSVVGLLLAVAVGWGLAMRMLERPVPVFTQLTFQRGFIPSARFTKEGATVIYGGRFDNDPLQIYSVRIGVLQPVKVDMPSAALFAVSPGDQMAVGTDPQTLPNSLIATLAEVPVTGGTPRPLDKTVSSADYMPDGKTLALTRNVGGRWVLEFPHGNKVFETGDYLDGLRVSPNGKSVAFLDHPDFGDDRGWVAMIDSGGKVRKLTEEQESITGLAWAEGGDELWFTATMTGSSNTLYGVKVSGGQGLGKVRKILGMPTIARLMDLGPNGRLLVAAETNNFTIAAMDGATGREIPHMELYNGSVLQEISPDGKAILFTEVGGSVGTLYEVVYRKTDGSPPLVLGPGASPRLSPDGSNVAAILLTSPSQLVIYPVGAGESRTLKLGNLTSAREVRWFPDGKHLAIVGMGEGKLERSYVMDLSTGQLQPLGPEQFKVQEAAKDGKRILGVMPAGWVIFNTETQQQQPVKGIGENESAMGWTRDDEGLMVEASEPGAVSIYRLDLSTGKRTTLKTVEMKDRSGVMGLFVELAKDEKSYATLKVTTMDTLWMADGMR
jgi:Tol biopolymer transport system component